MKQSIDAGSPASPPASISPVLPLDDLAAHQATWPTVVGIISIVYAVFGFFANGCGAILLHFSGATLALAGIDAGDIQRPRGLLIVETALATLGLLLAILLGVGAIALIRRRPSALQLLRIWTVGSIMATLIGIGVGFASVESNVEWQLAIQDAYADKVRRDGGDPSAYPQLNYDAEDMRKASIRNLAMLGALPILYPAIVGFLITSRARVEQAAAWNDSTPID
jgi:hypothetical protein